MTDGNAAEDQFEQTEVEALRAYLAERDIASSVEEATEDRGGSITFKLPSGRGEREVTILYFMAKAAREGDVAKWRLSEKYTAIFHSETGQTEVGLALPRHQGEVVPIWDLEGVIKGPDFGSHTDEPLDSSLFSSVSSSFVRIFGVEIDWHLPIETDEYSMSIGPVSDMLFAVRRAGFDSVLSIKVKHRDGADGPTADAMIDGPVRDFLTELDFAYGLSIQLASWSSPLATVPLTLDGATPSFPRNSYADEPKTLYWYGNGAKELPLVQFLAYYQVLEFYFPQFNREAVIHRLRTKLKDPSFDAGDSAHLDRLISATAEAHYGVRNELEQLRATLRTCVDDDDLKAYLMDESRRDHFTRNKQSMKSVRPINLKQDLHEQVAGRIYQIRNRIVHTKDLDEGSGLELLLPTSQETKTMGPEIRLVRWLAQRAMIHGSTPYPR